LYIMVMAKQEQIHRQTAIGLMVDSILNI